MMLPSPTSAMTHETVNLYYKWVDPEKWILRFQISSTGREQKEKYAAHVTVHNRWFSAARTGVWCDAALSRDCVGVSRADISNTRLWTERRLVMSTAHGSRSNQLGEQSHSSLERVLSCHTIDTAGYHRHYRALLVQDDNAGPETLRLTFSYALCRQRL